MHKFFFLLILAIPLLTQAKTADELVKIADNYRQNADEIKVDTLIKLFKNDALDKERRYDVYIKPGRKSLVISKTPSEKGQRVLMLDDKFWILLPKTKRPIRITPMQKLLGEASSGDIANMRWHEDYSATFLSSDKNNESANIELVLSAKRKGVTYKKIHLSLAPESNFPVKAELYLTSGKLAKIALFEMAMIDERMQVTKMILKDRIKKNQHTEIEYLEIKPYSLNRKFFNPGYLAKNPTMSIR